MSTVIKVSNLSKKYTIGHQRHEAYRTLRDSLREAIEGFGNRLLRPFRCSSDQPLMSSKSTEEFWALKDINFEIKRGDRVGIIGKNGAGKTTLLKILSRITEATTGRISIKGRVASLLEVGTGFHPELTGRENIFLNGAILGMTKTEIRKKFGEIVAFAEVEKFLDTPVKRYSSGMYVRLAFAVAAHLDPEILVVDEVLAVGDAAFQKKCLGKMDDVARGGRTVLFVSHKMSAIKTLCNQAMLIDAGRVIQEGTPVHVVNTYLSQDVKSSGQTIWAENNRPGNQSFQLISATLKNANGQKTSEIKISEEAVVEIEYEVINSGTQAMFSIGFWDANDNLVFNSLSNGEENSYHGIPLKKGKYLVTCQLYGNLLSEGHYYVSLVSSSERWSDSFRVDHMLSFDTIDDGVLKGDFVGEYYSGMVRPKLRWETKSL